MNTTPKLSLIEQNNNVGTSTSTSELDRKLVVRDGTLSQPTHSCLFLDILSSTSKHEMPLLSGHGRDVPSARVCLSSSGLDSLCCSWFEFQAKVFEDVGLKLKKKKPMTPPNIETARNKCVETCMLSKQLRSSHGHVDPRGQLLVSVQ